MSAGDPTTAMKSENDNPSSHQADATVDASDKNNSNNVADREILQPNATLYVSNIDWGIKKNVLKRSLLSLFERHGKVLEIITLRREGLRGQAWIIFEDVSAAIAAHNTENGFNFFGKPLLVQYAKEKSDRIAKRDGTFVPKDRRRKQPKNKQGSSPLDNNSNGVDTSMVTTSANNVKVELNDSSNVDEAGNNTNSNNNNNNNNGGGVGGVSSAAAAGTGSDANNNNNANQTMMEIETPSNILFAQDLPAECSEMMLAMLFRQYAGYKEVRIPRSGLAFIEFDDEPHATLALQGLNGFNLTTKDRLKLKYGKK